MCVVDNVKLDKNSKLTKFVLAIYYKDIFNIVHI